MAKRRDANPDAVTVRRYDMLRWALGITVFILVARLSYLQVSQGDIYADQATGNRIRPIALKAQRGPIYGRTEDVILASNRPSYDVYLIPKHCEGVEEQVCSLLSQLIGIDAAPLLEAIEKKESTPFAQVLIKSDITRSELVSVEENAYALPGVFTVVRPEREYPYGKTAGQLIGWFNEINDKELLERPGYRMGDVLGRAGIEGWYEPRLKGIDGRMVVSVANSATLQYGTDAFGNRGMPWDQLGRKIIIESRKEPVQGLPIHVTLDMELQQRAEQILARQVPLGAPEEAPEGAIVVLDADTGAILTMASVPGYDPNIFSGGKRPQNREQISALLANADGLKRMRHRAFQERYFPGSIFKILMAAAALEEGVVNTQTTFGCNGRYKLGNITWRCHHVHGGVNVVQALTVSCDVYFYTIGRALGIERINKWASIMGVGEITGVDLPDEDSGLVPCPAWKEIYFASSKNKWERKWHEGETVNVSIGQGDCKITPLQAATMMAIIVNGGKRVRPFISQESGPNVSGPIISPETIAIVQEGLRQCVSRKRSPGIGTGRDAQTDGYDIIGKTGTAQVVPRSRYVGLKDADIKYAFRDHAWFVAGVLDRTPRIAICVLVPHGLHGGWVAPIAKELILFYYERENADFSSVKTGRETSD